MSRRAYVWLLMKGDSYLPGIIASATSVKTIYDKVVMVTPDVSESARNEIRKYCIVHPVAYIEKPTKKFLSSRQEKYYGWKSVAYTKWNCLSLSYDKILFLDADTLVLENIDHLFELRAPAAPFNSPYITPLGKIRNFLQSREHNTLISKESIRNMLYYAGLTLTASCVLLEPSQDDYEGYLSMLNEYKVYGHHCFSGFDEQSIAEFYIFKKNKTWRNIHHKYNSIDWKEGYLQEPPVILHYISPNKPWNMEPDSYPDVTIWHNHMNTINKN